MTYELLKNHIDLDPSASYFIKDMMYEADRRDAVDVINDCEEIIRIMKVRMAEHQHA
jgi:hypothetical protein